MSLCTSHDSCIESAIKQAELICAKGNLRFTTLRRTVLKLIWASHEPSKAYDILEQLSNEDNHAKPPTVYRTLDFLLENGLVHRLNSLNAYVGCGHPQHHRHCYFLICTSCGKIEECCSPELKSSIYTTTSEHGFEAKQVSLEIQGECSDCQTIQNSAVKTNDLTH